jgi:hypothetical protein
MLNRVIEKILSSLLISFVLMLCSFAYFSGHFPPRKDDLFRSITLVKMMLSTSKDYNAKAQAYGNLQTLSLDQMAEMQRLSLRRTEISLELLKIYKRLQFGQIDPVMEQKLIQTKNLLDSADKNLEDVSQQLLKKNSWLQPPQGNGQNGS